MISQDIQIAIRVMHARHASCRQIANALQISRNTVAKYISEPDKTPVPSTGRPRLLSKHAEIVDTLFRQHLNCDVVRQELSKKGINASLRSIERWVKPIREELQLHHVRALKRIETPPGEYMQIDYGTRKAMVGGKEVMLKLFVAVLAYSRRIFVMVTPNEERVSWMRGIEGAFRHFGGLPKAIICDNAKPLVFKPAKRGKRRCELDDVFLNFCKHWNVMAIACYARYPEAKGKVERAVGYVKNNAIAGHKFDSIEAVQPHLDSWMKEVSDNRKMDLAPGEERCPAIRFISEAPTLRPLDRANFNGIRELFRTVSAKGLIEVDTNQYAMGVAYRGKNVTVRVYEDVHLIKVFEANGDLIKEFDQTLDVFKSTTTTGMEGGKLNFGTTDSRLTDQIIPAEVSKITVPIPSLAIYDDCVEECGHA